jgi:chromosome segregation ATPase
MSRKPKKRRSEAQNLHTTTLHRSRSDPIGYREASHEELKKTIYQQKKRIFAAEADAEHSKNTLVDAENQVCTSMGVKRECENSEMH